MSGFALLLISFVLVVLIVGYDAITRDDPIQDDADKLEKFRKAEIERKRGEALAWMAANGKKTLLGGRKSWVTIKPMASPEPSATVIQIGKRKGRA